MKNVQLSFTNLIKVDDKKIFSAPQIQIVSGHSSCSSLSKNASSHFVFWNVLLYVPATVFAYLFAAQRVFLF